MSWLQKLGSLALSLGTLLVGARPSVAEALQPTLVVVNKGAKELAIVDLNTNKVVGRVPVGDDPHSVAASSDGKFAYVANSNYGKGMGSISVIDIASRKELRRINIGPHTRPHGIVYSNGKVYFTAEGYKMIGCYNPANDQVEWLVGTGQGQSVFLALNKNADKIFTANVTSNSVSVIEVGAGDLALNPTNWNQLTVPVKTQPHSISVTPDGKEVWVGGRLDGHFTIIDASTYKILQTIDFPNWKSGERMAFTPDGKRALIPNSGVNDGTGGGEVAVIDVASRKEIKRISVGPSLHLEEVIISPDGSKAYVASANEDGFVVINLKTLEITDRVMTGKVTEGMAWAGGL